MFGRELRNTETNRVPYTVQVLPKDDYVKNLVHETFKNEYPYIEEMVLNHEIKFIDKQQAYCLSFEFHENPSKTRIVKFSFLFSPEASAKEVASWWMEIVTDICELGIQKFL